MPDLTAYPDPARRREPQRDRIAAERASPGTDLPLTDFRAPVRSGDRPTRDVGKSGVPRFRNNPERPRADLQPPRRPSFVQPEIHRGNVPGDEKYRPDDQSVKLPCVVERTAAGTFLHSRLKHIGNMINCTKVPACYRMLPALDLMRSILSYSTPPTCCRCQQPKLKLAPQHNTARARGICDQASATVCVWFTAKAMQAPAAASRK